VLTINDRQHQVSVDVRMSLLDLLRERLGLTGAKKATITANAATSTGL
jgi:aerobic-type carbon monoxide dehydrogenase small subunit (CoxS/CutS family)